MQMPFTGERYVPELRGQIYYEHLHRYALAFAMARDLDVLDIASGEGYGAAYLAMVARSVTGVDIDPHSVRHAASRYTAMNLSFVVGSCTQIPLSNESIDLVVSFETVEHIAEQEQFMREIVRVLRPNGRLLMSSPNKLIYSNYGQYQNPFHVRELYFDEFRDLVQHWFPHSRLFGQRIFAASAVHPLRGLAPDARCIGPTTREDEWGLPALPAPAYFIAVCSRSEAEDGLEPLVSVFLDPRDDLLQHLTQPDPPPQFAEALNAAGGALQIESASGATQLPRAAGEADAERALFEQLVRRIYGNESAELPPIAEAVAKAHEHLRLAYELHEQTKGRLSELEADLAAERARSAEVEAQRAQEVRETDLAFRAATAQAERRLQLAVDKQHELTTRAADLEAELVAERRWRAESEAQQAAAAREVESAVHAATAQAEQRLQSALESREQLTTRVMQLEAELTAERRRSLESEAQQKSAAGEAASLAREASAQVEERLQLARQTHRNLTARVDELEAELRAERRRFAESEAQQRAAAEEAAREATAQAAEERLAAESHRMLAARARELEVELAAERERGARKEDQLRALRREADSLRSAHAGDSDRLRTVENAQENSRSRMTELEDALATERQRAMQIETRYVSAVGELAALRSQAAARVPDMTAGEREALLEECAELRGTIAQLDVRADHAGRDLAEMRDRLAQAHAEIVQNHALLEEVLDSRSWRLTKPVRLAARMLRGGRS